MSGMPLPHMPDAVVFDMDGLLIDSEALVREGVFRAVTAMGFAMTDGVFARMIGLSLAESTKVLESHFGPAFETPRFLTEERREIEALFAEGVALKAGVIELLDHLDELGLPRAVATSSSRDAVDAHLGGRQNRPAIEFFRVEQQAVHVEHDGGNGARESHLVPLKKWKLNGKAT